VVGGALFGLIGVVLTCCVPIGLSLMTAMAGLSHIAAGVACLRRDLTSGRALRVTAIAAGIAQLVVSALGCMLAEAIAAGPWAMEGDPPLSGPEAARLRAHLALVLTPLLLWMGYVAVVFWVTSPKYGRR
jgi:cytochrome c biogenesis factor